MSKFRSYSLLLNNSLLLFVYFKPIFVDFAPVFDMLVLLAVYPMDVFIFLFRV